LPVSNAVGGREEFPQQELNAPHTSLICQPFEAHREGHIRRIGERAASHTTREATVRDERRGRWHPTESNSECRERLEFFRQLDDSVPIILGVDVDHSAEIVVRLAVIGTGCMKPGDDTTSCRVEDGHLSGA
jgi:hypothetical protein